MPVRTAEITKAVWMLVKDQDIFPLGSMKLMGLAFAYR
jgi:hypothetical protein